MCFIGLKSKKNRLRRAPSTHSGLLLISKSHNISGGVCERRPGVCAPLPCQPPSNEHKVSVRECDVRPTWPVSAGWPLTLPTWIVLRAPAVHGVSSVGVAIANRRYGSPSAPTP